MNKCILSFYEPFFSKDSGQNKILKQYKLDGQNDKEDNKNNSCTFLSKQSMFDGTIKSFMYIL